MVFVSLNRYHHFTPAELKASGDLQVTRACLLCILHAHVSDRKCFLVQTAPLLKILNSNLMFSTCPFYSGVPSAESLQDLDVVP